MYYRDAGVDIDCGNQWIECIKPIAEHTRRPEQLGGIGHFSALFEVPLNRFKHPVIVSSTDGVGTKLKLAQAYGDLSTLGIDLVAMCVNDVLTCGAEPMMFLDYYATGRLTLSQATTIMEGIGRGCELAGITLAGGETAEMPGCYQGDEFDLAGFCVGLVDKLAIIDGQRVQEGDVVIGLASSGPHANGYALIRHILTTNQVSLTEEFQCQPLGAVLLKPTRIYVKSLLPILPQIHALAHITGGGLIENVPRVLPQGLIAKIHLGSWPRPAIFDWIQQQGHLSDTEMYRTFNNGIGMVLVVTPAKMPTVLAHLADYGESAWVIGEVQAI